MVTKKTHSQVVTTPGEVMQVVMREVEKPTHSLEVETKVAAKQGETQVEMLAETLGVVETTHSLEEGMTQVVVMPEVVQTLAETWAETWAEMQEPKVVMKPLENLQHLTQ